MTSRRRRIVLALVLTALLTGAAALWLGWDQGYAAVRAKYDRVEIGMTLEEAEAALGLSAADPPPVWDYYTAPVYIDSEIAQTGPWESDENIYIEGGYWAFINYNPSTKAVITKELRRTPSTLEVQYKRVFNPDRRFPF